MDGALESFDDSLKSLDESIARLSTATDAFGTRFGPKGSIDEEIDVYEWGKDGLCGEICLEDEALDGQRCGIEERWMDGLRVFDIHLLQAVCVSSLLCTQTQRKRKPRYSGLGRACYKWGKPPTR
jgi:hypothetical protein